MKFKSLFEELKEKTSPVNLCPKPEIIRGWAAVELIFHPYIGGLPSVAMIKRAENESDPWSGHYAFPGGRVEKGESLRDAAKRETLEEVGFLPSEDWYLGEFLKLQLRYKGEYMPFAISAHTSLIDGSPNFKPCPLEVEDAFWFPLEKLLDPNNVSERVFEMSSWKGKLPCIEFDGHVIWGISYVILRELFIQWHGSTFGEGGEISGTLYPQYPHIKGSPLEG